MPLSPVVLDRERDKFVEDSSGETAVRVVTSLDGVSGLPIPYHDEGSVTYPTSTQEVYTFKLVTVTVGVLTLNYTSATKEFLLNWSLV